MIKLADGSEILQEDKLIKEESCQTTLLNSSKLISVNHILYHLVLNLLVKQTFGRLLVLPEKKTTGIPDQAKQTGGT